MNISSTYSFGNLQLVIRNPKFVLLLSALLFARSLSVEAQQQTNVPKIGFLAARSASGPRGGSELFRREFIKLGYVEGKNVAFEFRRADDNYDRLPALADELVRLKVDVLVTPAVTGALALKRATRTIPIVFIGVSDPIATGLVESHARPGGNITGFTSIETVLAGKRLELLKETVSKLSRVAVLWDPKNQGSELSWKESQVAARQLGLQLQSMEVSSADNFEIGFKKANTAGGAALAVTLNALANSNQKRIADLAAKHRMPAIYPRGDFVDSGGLMSYAADQTEPYKRAAIYVDKTLKGAKPADLPVEQPAKFEFVINLKAAKQIGITIPPNVLARADNVIR